MRFSKMLIPTLKEAPSDATLPSHKYLIRGGFIQSVGAGLYNFLPLGKRVLDNVRRVVKEELDKAGAQEVDLAFVTPASLWHESNRYEKYGKELLRFKDRKDNEFVLGPTHEEMMVNLVRSYVRSYKELPLNLYQIKVKFRDEIRPRFGLLRAREFLMKDGYSFHKDREDMVREFNLMEETYSKIFKRLGLDFRIVEADSGAIGGSGSKEFMVLANSGEDTLVVCKECDYGANIEAAKREIPTSNIEPPEAEFNEFFTPDVKTIDDLAKFFRVDPFYLVKIVAKRVIFDNQESKIVLFALRGDDELQEVKALNSVDGNELVDVSEEELKEAGLEPGFMGLFKLPSNIEVVTDISLKDANNLIMGANRKDYHLIGVSLKDYNGKFDDIASVREGDRCPKCGGELYYTKGIEVGHIFQLGTRYSEPLKAHFLDENGKSKPFVMGTYGIGVSRVVAAIIEQHHDDKGMIWTKESAPFDIEIIISNIKNEKEREFGFLLYEELKSRGYEVLIDDRKERFGFKMADFELIGIPFGIVVGKKLNEDKIELIKRANLEKISLDSSDTNELIKNIVEYIK
ncbi:MAG: proline--tRNA ligase [Epsilonproteobacteria bacterium]|nr:proline--tRNA ligase [Campylobacterota bacterium]